MRSARPSGIEERAASRSSESEKKEVKGLSSGGGRKNGTGSAGGEEKVGSWAFGLLVEFLSVGSSSSAAPDLGLVDFRLLATESEAERAS